MDTMELVAQESTPSRRRRSINQSCPISGGSDRDGELSLSVRDRLAHGILSPIRRVLSPMSSNVVRACWPVAASLAKKGEWNEFSVVSRRGSCGWLVGGDAGQRRWLRSHWRSRCRCDRCLPWRLAFQHPWSLSWRRAPGQHYCGDSRRDRAPLPRASCQACVVADQSIELTRRWRALVLAILWSVMRNGPFRALLRLRG